MIQHSLDAVVIAHRLGVSIAAGTDTTYDADEPTVIDEIKHLADSGLVRWRRLNCVSVRRRHLLSVPLPM